MAKFHGPIGYSTTVETVPGVWEDTIVERNVTCDVLKNTKKNENSDNLNDNITVSIQLSFLADPYALQNFQLIKYAKYMGSLWKVTVAEVAYPRLILTLGGVYNA